MRILMTVSSTSLMDGINRHVLTIAPALNALEDVEVGVVTLHPWGAFNDALRAAGVPCWSLDCANGHQLKVLPRFCRVMRAFRPDAIHVHVMGFFACVAHKWLYPKVKRVVTIHGISDPVADVAGHRRDRSLPGLGAVCRALSDRRADALIHVSQGVAAHGRAADGPSFVVYNPTSFRTPPARAPRCVAGVGARPLVVGTACRVAEVKNPLAFTRVMGEVTARLAQAEAWVIGAGPALEACRGLAATNGYNKITFWGARNDAKERIAQMDCFVMTSLREGMPGALLEAMAARTPIAFMKGEGGLRDLAEMNEREGPFAVVVEPGDEAGLVAGICDLLNDPEKAAAYAQRAFEVGRRHFDVARIAEQLHDIYAGVLTT